MTNGPAGSCYFSIKIILNGFRPAARDSVPASIRTGDTGRGRVYFLTNSSACPIALRSAATETL